jgi:hypothetical protein
MVLCRTIQGQKTCARRQEKQAPDRARVWGYLGSRLVSRWKSCKPSATELDLGVTTDCQSVLPCVAKNKKAAVGLYCRQYTSTPVLPKIIAAVGFYCRQSACELFFLSAPGPMMLPKHKIWVSYFTRFGCVTHTSVHYRLRACIRDTNLCVTHPNFWPGSNKRCSKGSWHAQSGRKVVDSTLV